MSRFDEAMEEAKAAAREWARSQTERDRERDKLLLATISGFAELHKLQLEFQRDKDEERDGDPYR